MLKLQGKVLDRQIEAEVVDREDIDRRGYLTVTEEVPRWFGRGTKTKTRKVHVGYLKRPARDDEEVMRTFEHTCSLVHFILARGRRGHLHYTCQFDGFPAANFQVGELMIRFDAARLESNGGMPLADIVFFGKGTRRGPLEYRDSRTVVLTFKDADQVKKFFTPLGRRMPEDIKIDETTYSRQDDGTYQSQNGSILPYLVILWMLLPSAGRAEMVSQNPGVQELLRDCGVVAGDAEGQASADAPTIEIDGNEVDFADTKSEPLEAVGDAGAGVGNDDGVQIGGDNNSAVTFDAPSMSSTGTD